MNDELLMKYVVEFLQTQGYACTYKGYKIPHNNKENLHEIHYNEKSYYPATGIALLSMSVYDDLGDVDKDKEVCYFVYASDITLKISFFASNFNVCEEGKNLSMQNYSHEDEIYEEEWMRFLIKQNPRYALYVFSNHQASLDKAKLRYCKAFEKLKELQRYEQLDKKHSQKYYKNQIIELEKELDCLQIVIDIEKSVTDQALKIEREIKKAEQLKKNAELNILENYVK